MLWSAVAGDVAGTAACPAGASFALAEVDPPSSAEPSGSEDKKRRQESIPENQTRLRVPWPLVV